MTDLNSDADLANKIIANANSAGAKALEALIIADFPIPFGLPVIKTLFSWGIGFLDGYISQVEQKGITFVIIDGQAAGEETALSKALANLIAAEKSGDPNVIKKAIQAYADCQSALVHDDGSAPPH